MKLKNISFRIQVTAGFITILMLFVIGLGICIININKISGFMDISSETNLIVKEMFAVREIEKEFFSRKELTLLTSMDQSVGILSKRTIDLSEKTSSVNLSMGLQAIEALIQDYYQEFQQTAKYTDEIDQLQKKMKTASDTIFSTVETKIRGPILKKQNSALITGEELNPAFSEIIKVVDSLMLELKDAWAFEKSFYLYNDPEYITRFNTKLKAWNQVKSDLVFLINTSEDKNLLAAYTIVTRQFEFYNSETMNSIFSLYKENDKISAVTQSKGSQILSRVQELQQEAQDMLIDSKNFTINLAVVLLVLGIIIGLSATYFIVISITKPINKTVEFVRAMAEGDFKIRMNFDRKDEIGRLSKSLDSLADDLQLAIRETNEVMAQVAAGDLSNRIRVPLNGDLNDLKTNVNKSIDILGETLSQVVQTSNDVSNNATGLTSSSQTLANGATHQASSLEETHSSMNEVETRAKTNSETALRASHLTDQTISIVSRGDKQMGEMLVSMNQINGTSTDISKIIKTIDEIAFQTNLLALNAAVEAARAGKYGKGFAVVAEEVRNLASRSAKAAKSTSELIETSVKEVERGVEKAEKTAEILKEINHSITKVNDMVSEISAASKEQRDGIEEINEGLNQVNKIVQQNSTISEETASSSEALMLQATTLKGLMNQFTLIKS